MTDRHKKKGEALNRKILRVIAAIALALALIFLVPEASQAVPSYARQTNLPCSSCHYMFPELQPFGRLFKLHGYTLVGADVIEAKDKNDRTTLSLLKIPPLSGMVQASFSKINKTLPGTQNNDIGFPEQLSFFFAGQVTPHLGAFVQFTYAIEGASFGWDLVDIRYSHQTSVGSRDLVLGATLNDNPTIQDVWNSTPVWGFPYAASSVVPEPAAAALVDGGLEREVAGLGAYAFFDGRLYGEFDLYRSAPQGGPHPPDQTSSGIIKNMAPYWRVALQHEWGSHYLEIGTFGLTGKLFPNGVSGLTDKYTDIAFDLQTEHRMGNSKVTGHGIWIHEKQDLEATYESGGSANPTNKLNTLRLNANCYFMEQWGLSLGYFSTTGDKDTGLYAQEAITGSRTGEPNTDGIIAELAFLPWLNTKFTLQYVIYSKFNGAKDDYDGFGRKASDNNTIFLLSWFAM